MSLHITKAVIENIGSIRFEEIIPSEICIRAGRNASGKSSGVKALRAAFTKGSHRNLINNDAEEGSVTVELSNGVAIQRVLRRDREPVVTLSISGAKVKSPQSVIDSLSDAFVIDILKWLNLKDEDQGKLLLESLPLRVDMEAVKRCLEKLPEQTRAEISLPHESQHALVFLEMLRKEVFSSRTATNRELKRVQGHLESLKAALPATTETGETWTTVYEEKSLELQSIYQEHEGVLLAQNARKMNSLGKAKAAFDAERERIRKEAEKAIAEVAAAYEIETASKREEFEAERDDLLTRHQVETAQLQGEIERAKAKAEIERASLETKRRIEETEEAVELLSAESEGLTQTINNLDGYRDSLLVDLPIEGLEMQDGKIARNGVLLSETNTAALLDLSLDVAHQRMRPDSLHVVFVDNMECLDEESQRAFLNKASEMNIQVFGAMVRDGELTQLSMEDFKQDSAA